MRRGELVSNLLIELGAQGVAIATRFDYVGNVTRSFGEIFPDVEQQEEIVVTAYLETVDVAVEADLYCLLRN